MVDTNPYFDELSDTPVRTKICQRCGEHKHIDHFAHRSYSKNGDRETKNYCKDCDRIAQKLVEKIKKQIGPPKDNHVCDCCGKTEQAILTEFRLHQGTKKKTVWTYDHDHKTGLFRGIICQPCNTVMGNLKDSLDVANKVVKYIKKHNER